MTLRFCFVLTLCMTSQPVPAEDFPQDWHQWRGPHRNGQCESSIQFSPQSSIQSVWEVDIGTGFSSPVVSGQTLVVMGNVNDFDVVTALNAKTGEEIWTYKYQCPLDPNLFEGGPTSTPSINEEKVVCVGRQGQIHCLHLKTGELLWDFDIAKILEYNIPTWGFAGSPLIVDQQVFLNAGSHGICLNLNDGNLIWDSSNDEDAGYSSPLRVNIGEQRLLLMMSAKSLNAINPENGELHWSQRWITRYGINAADPVPVSKDRVLVSSGYGKGTGLVQVSGDEPELLWRTREIRNQMSPGVVVDGAVYAIDGDETETPRLVCFSPESGDVHWSQNDFGAGSLIAVNQQILVLSASGELTVFDANSKEFTPILTKQINSGKCWTPITFAGNRLYSRNASGTLNCSVVQ